MEHVNGRPPEPGAAAVGVHGNDIGARATT